MSPVAGDGSVWTVLEHGKTTFYISVFAYLVVLYVCSYVYYFCSCMNIYTCTMYECMCVGKALPSVTLSMIM